MDPYQVLGVAPGADAAELRSAYRRAVWRYHPDRDPSPAAAAQFLTLQQAWESISAASAQPNRAGADMGSGDVVFVSRRGLRARLAQQVHTRMRRAGLVRSRRDLE
ncbi:MAG: J domain-containing protein [Sporichthyaceae bacterium]